MSIVQNTGRFPSGPTTSDIDTFIRAVTTRLATGVVGGILVRQDVPFKTLRPGYKYPDVPLKIVLPPARQEAGHLIGWWVSRDRFAAL